ncbi:MAG: acyl-CoA thioesterase [Halanaeroarchaeum sp.]
MTDMPYETEVAVRYSDRDTLGHVNNAVFATFLEEARIAFVREILEDSIERRSMVIASLEIGFRAPVTGWTVTVGLDVTDVGESSFTIDYEIESDGEVVATASTVQVAVDPDSGETRPVPTGWREGFERMDGGSD